MRRQIRLFLRLLGPAIFLGILYWYVDLQEFKIFLGNLKWSYFWVSLAVVPALVLVRTLRWKIILSTWGIHHPLWRYFKIYFVEMVAVMVVATVGTFIKAFYLKSEHGLLRPGLSIVADKFFDYLLPFFFGLASAFLVWLEIGANTSLVIIFAVVLMMFFPARKTVLIFNRHLVPNRLRTLFHTHNRDVNEYLADIYQALDFRNYALSVLGFVLYFFAIYFLSLGINLTLSFSQMVMILSITTLFSVIPVSFLGVGAQDVGFLYVFQLFNYRPEDAVLFSLALLFLRLAILLLGAIFWMINPPPLAGRISEQAIS